MPPQRSVILDTELCEHARGQPVRVSLASPGKLDDLFPHKLGHPIFRAHGKLELDAHSVKRLVHGLNMLGLESESMGSRSWHHGVADGLERDLSRPFRRLQLAADQSVTGPGRSGGGGAGTRWWTPRRAQEQPQSTVKVGPDPPWGVGGTLDRGRAPWGEQAQPISICACEDRKRPPARGLFLLLGLTPTLPGPKAPRSVYRPRRSIVARRLAAAGCRSACRREAPDEAAGRMTDATAGVHRKRWRAEAERCRRVRPFGGPACGQSLE
jgi:hypothetical protein